MVENVSGQCRFTGNENPALVLESRITNLWIETSKGVEEEAAVVEGPVPAESFVLGSEPTRLGLGVELAEEAAAFANDGLGQAENAARVFSFAFRQGDERLPKPIHFRDATERSR